jgi:hypothetical protein
MRLQYVCSHAASIADNRRENDGAVDISPSAAARSSSSGFKNSAHVMRNAEACRRLFRVDGGLRKLPHDIRFERRDINVARIEYCYGVRIVAERRQQVLKSYLGRAGSGRKLGAARQRYAEIRRHRNLSKIGSSYAHDVSRHTVKDRVKIGSRGNATA